ncbi:hypothetical protein [Micromonospora sp. NPDC050495]|uniref:hypothetical protein n=1 Tax=Micromonospora sp. NPDC050495 TaxID=3154936 RepID=UPI0033C524C5
MALAERPPEWELNVFGSNMATISRYRDGALLINGIDVAPLVEAELNRRLPGRELRHAADPVGLRTVWAALERAWAAAVDRVRAMPEGTVLR